MAPDGHEVVLRPYPRDLDAAIEDMPRRGPSGGVLEIAPEDPVFRQIHARERHRIAEARETIVAVLAPAGDAEKLAAAETPPDAHPPRSPPSYRRA